MNFGIGSTQKSLLDIINEEDPEQRKTMIYSDFFTQSIGALTYYKESVRPVLRVHAGVPGGPEHQEAQVSEGSGRSGSTTDAVGVTPPTGSGRARRPHAAGPHGGQGVVGGP